MSNNRGRDIEGWYDPTAYPIFYEQREGKTQLPVLFCMNALQTVIGHFTLFHSDLLKSVQSKQQQCASSDQCTVERSDGWSIYNSLISNNSKVETSDGCSIYNNLMSNYSMVETYDSWSVYNNLMSYHFDLNIIRGS